jgi:hypothetical protein
MKERGRRRGRWRRSEFIFFILLSHESKSTHYFGGKEVRRYHRKGRVQMKEKQGVQKIKRNKEK